MFDDLRPARTRPVQVLVEGQWHDGQLEALRHEHGEWLGWVRWARQPGYQHIGWYRESSLRKPPDDATASSRPPPAPPSPQPSSPS